MRAIKYTIAVAAMAVSGCAQLSECVDDCSTGVHNDVTSMEAWCRWRWCYEDVDHQHHFAKGFRAGYRDVLNGGEGCQPTLPPRHYWKYCYRNAEGHCKVNAWFDGFSHGALAAKQDGAGNFGGIPLSPAARGAMERANCPPMAYDWSAMDPTGAPPAMEDTELEGDDEFNDAPEVPPIPGAMPIMPDSPNTGRPYEEAAEPVIPQAGESTAGRLTIPGAVTGSN